MSQVNDTLKITSEFWQLDQTGIFVKSPIFTQWRGDMLAGLSVRKADNMQQQNHRLNLCRRLDIDPAKLAVSYQVHGQQIQVIKTSADIPLGRVGGVDGWIVSGSAPGAILGVFGSDCPSVFIVHREMMLAGLLHAGRRGLAAGIVPGAGRMLINDFKASPQDFAVFIGPHIRSCCYETGEDVARQFPKRWTQRRGGKIYLDLSHGISEELDELGFNNIFVSLDCTFCSKSALYYSYRRRDPGSMMAFLHFLG